MLTVNVLGIPAQQGSKNARYVPKMGRAVVYEQTSKKLKPWRQEMAACLNEAMHASSWTTLDEPAEVEITFFHPRPKAHYGTGRNAGVLKATAPSWKSTMPDIDKLTRSVLDALTASAVIKDDSRVARLVVEDRWADAAAGARITVRPLNPSPVAASTPTAGEAPTQEGTPS